MKKKMLSRIMVAFLLLASFHTWAQSSGEVYLISYFNPNSTLYRVQNPSTTSASVTAMWSISGARVDGLAYNPADDNFYGVLYPSSTFVRMDRTTGALTTLPLAVALPPAVQCGEIANNTYYCMANIAPYQRLEKIDLTTLAHTSIPMSANVACRDWGYYNGKLYGTSFVPETAGGVWSIDVNTGATVQVNTTAPAKTVGDDAVYSDGTGIIYFNAAGTFNVNNGVYTSDFYTGGVISPYQNIDGTYVKAATPLTYAGAIAADQGSCGGFDPAPIIETAPASGGSGAAIEYRWWANGSLIAGATGINYDPGFISATTSYQREARRGNTAWLASNVVTMTVYDCQLTNGGAIAAPQSNCGAFDPAPITETVAPSGGNGVAPLEYRWWANGSLIAGATGINYDPGVISATTTYQREVRRGNTNWVASNAVTMTVYNCQLNNGGTIAAPQSNCGAFDPAAITETVAPSGGNGVAPLEYRWWANGVVIPGATGINYDPGVISATTTYQREVRRGNTNWVASNAVTMTVYDCQLNSGGTIAAPQSNCGAFDPAAITETVAPSGGNGVAPLEYRWWANGVVIPGATGINYDPGMIAVTTTYQREVRRGNTNWVASNAITKTVNAAPVVGLLANPVSTISNLLNEGTPVVLSASGANTYSWADGVTGSPRDVIATNGNKTYTVTGTSSAGCTSTQSLIVYGRSAPLPVTFSSFTARKNGCNAQLNWVTETEHNNDHFEVEHAAGGKVFSVIGKVDAAHKDGRQEYSFTDEHPAQGLNQYRIAQVDVDGKRTTTSINVVDMDCDGKDAVMVYPTVTNGTVNIKLPAGYEKAEISVFNSTGQEVIKKVPGAGISSLQLTSLAKGQYLIRIANGGNQQVFKVIYQ